jgi:phosphatidylglycerol phospholipase C
MSVLYARRFLATSNVNFNMSQKTLIGPMGNRFLRDARANKRAVYDWTVNEVEWMEWSIKKDLDGVITDDPKLFLEICDRYEDELERVNARKRQTTIWRTIWLYLDVLAVNVLTTFIVALFLLAGQFR